MNRVLVVLVTGALALGAAACGGDDESSTPTNPSGADPLGRGGPIVTVGYSTPQEQINPVFDRFTSRYPNVSIETTGGTDDELADAVVREGAGAEAITDVLVVSNEQTLAGLAEEGLLLTLPQALRDLGTDGDPAGRWVRSGAKIPASVAVLKSSDEPQESQDFVRTLLEMSK